MIPTWVCLKRGWGGERDVLGPFPAPGQQLAWARPQAGETKCEAGTRPSGGTGASARHIPHLKPISEKATCRKYDTYFLI